MYVHTAVASPFAIPLALTVDLTGGELAHGARAARAGDFVNFRKFSPGTLRLLTPSTQSCDRKSKFGLRHAIKLNSVYGVTKSEL